MSTIRILEPHIANKIAAGEVIERPSSVIKELLENAIDAQADTITIDLEDGGLHKILISDNGVGMSKEDLPLAFTRHATSKINSFDDLFKLKSFGFRGEALASIAIVSQIVAQSGQSEEEPAWQYSLDAGDEGVFKKISPQKGTSIEVKNLFYNVPARRKFMKSATYEFNLIYDLVARYSLAYPNITFILYHQRKQVFTTIGRDNTEERLIYLYGNELRDHILHLEQTEIYPNTYAEAWLADSTFTRNTRSHEIIFVNGRLIKSRDLETLIESAYETYIPKGRFPLAVLKLSVPTETLDVNIHPAKTTIKFTQLERWKEKLLDCMRDQIWQSSVAINVTEARTESSLSQKKDVISRDNHTESEPRQSRSSQTRTHFIAQPKMDFSTFSNLDESMSTKNNLLSSAAEGQSSTKTSVFSVEEANNAYASRHADILPPVATTNDRGYLDTSLKNELTEPIVVNEMNNLSLIGQLNNTFILAQNEEALFIIDQHTCHERILYERYMEAESKKEIPVQMLLIPIQLTLSPKQEQSLLTHIIQLRDLGIILEATNERVYELKGVPAILHEVNNYYEFVLDLIETLEEKPQLTLADVREELVTTAACKGAVKANWPLSQEEIHRLMRELGTLNNPHSCPHGRPIVTKITMNELYHIFKRGSYCEH